MNKINAPMLPNLRSQLHTEMVLLHRFAPPPQQGLQLCTQGLFDRWTPAPSRWVDEDPNRFSDTAIQLLDFCKQLAG